MFREQRRLITRIERAQSRKMRWVRPCFATQRQADAMKRQRIELPRRGQCAVLRPAGGEIVFGMHLEPADPGTNLVADFRRLRQDVGVMLRPQPDPGACRNRAGHVLAGGDGH